MRKLPTRSIRRITFPTVQHHVGGECAICGHARARMLDELGSLRFGECPSRFGVRAVDTAAGQRSRFPGALRTATVFGSPRLRPDRLDERPNLSLIHISE